MKESHPFTLSPFRPFALSRLRAFALSPLRAFAPSCLRAFVPSRLRAFVLSCFRAFALSCLLPFTLFSQDYKADLEKACTIFTRDNYEVEIEHLFYPSYTAVAPIEKESMWVYKSGDNYHIRQYGVETIINPEYLVMIHEDEQIICLDEVQGTGKLTPEEKEGVSLMIKGMLNTANSLKEKGMPAATGPEVKYTGTANGSKTYRFDYKEGEYTRTDITLSAKTGLLEKITCYYRAPFELEEGKYALVKVDFVFKKQTVIKNIDNSQFSIGHILSVNARGEVTLREKYKGYNVINHIRR